MGHIKFLKKKASPPAFPEFKDNYLNSNLLTESMECDIAWVLLA